MNAKKISLIAAILALSLVVTFGLFAQSNSGGGSGGSVPAPSAVPAHSTAKQAALKTLASYGFVADKALTLLPDFEVPLLKGGKAKLSSFKGKLLVLNFWATWCPPCRGEMPSMQKTYDALKAKGFEILAVSYREKTATVKAFIDKNPYGYPIALDEAGALGEKYIGEGIPTTLLVDGEGRRLATVVGGIEWNAPGLVKALEALLAK